MKEDGAEWREQFLAEQLAEARRELEESMRVIAILLRKLGGRVSVSEKDLVSGYAEIRIAENRLTGVHDISVS